MRTSKLTVKAKVFGTSLLLLFLLAASSLYSILTMNSIGKEMVSIAEHDIPLTANLSKVTQHQLEQALHLEKAVRHAELASLRNDANETLFYKKEVKLFNKLEKQVKSEFKEGLQLAREALTHANTDAQIKEFKHIIAELERISTLYQSFIKHSHEVLDYIDADDLHHAEEVFQLVEEEEIKLDQGLVALSEEITKFTAEAALEAERHEQEAILVMIIITVLALGVGIALSILLVRGLERQLGADPSQIQKITNDIATGELDADTGVNEHNAVGVLASLLIMRKNLRESIENDRQLAAEMSRIKQALDVTSGNIMVADANNDIIYLNQAVQNMFRSAESDIQRDLPDFEAAKLIGSNIDQFHKDPSHQQNLVNNLSEQLNAGFVIGGRTMKFTANPVIAENGERLGTVVEWSDQTAQVAIQKEIETIISAARLGDLKQTIHLDDKEDFFLEFSKGMNELVTTVAKVFDDINVVIEAMAKGNLQRQIHGEYQGSFGEVQQNINTTIQSLLDIITNIRNASDQIKSGSDEISTANANLSSRTEEQASSLEETASALEELTATVRQNADNAQLANDLASNACNTAREGADIVTNAISAMEEINQSSARISVIVKVIEDIAFQTNLLALNASVEAARAGEQGRGFAVVASEVRNLALRSATSAKEIKELIQDSVHKVEAGSDLVNRSGEALDNIMSSVIKVGDIIEGISSASREQSIGIDQINTTVASLDDLTQQNSALAEQTSAASLSMNEHAVSMGSQVQFFQIGSPDNT